jgi:hypothetical protein
MALELYAKPRSLMGRSPRSPKRRKRRRELKSQIPLLLTARSQSPRKLQLRKRHLTLKLLQLLQRKHL